MGWGREWGIFLPTTTYTGIKVLIIVKQLVLKIKEIII
jgi:hypothetical protein